MAKAKNPTLVASNGGEETVNNGREEAASNGGEEAIWTMKGVWKSG